MSGIARSPAVSSAISSTVTPGANTKKPSGVVAKEPLGDRAWRAIVRVLTGASILVGVAIVGLVVLMFIPRWEEHPVGLEQTIFILGGEVPDQSIRSTHTSITLWASGCGDTIRFDVEESPDEIVVSAQRRLGGARPNCLREYSGHFELDEPVGSRQIVSKSNGHVFYP